MPVKSQLQTQTTPTPTRSSTTGGAGPDRQPGGNLATQDEVKAKVSGPIGRVWNHILGQPDGKDTSDAQVDQAMVRAYLEKRLGFAEGEFFRGKKLDGVAENLLKSFDKDGDKKLSWGEFQGFEETLGQVLAPKGKTAAGQHASTDENGDGAGLSEIQDVAEGQLPEGTQHADLIGQLGARVAIDAADKDEGGKPIGERKLSRDEWTSASKEIAARKKR